MHYQWPLYAVHAGLIAWLQLNPWGKDNKEHLRMKKLRMVFLFCFFAATKTFAQTPEAVKVLGLWISEDKTGKIDVYKANRKYFGKLIWGKTIYEPDGTTSRKGGKNKDEKLRARNLKYLIMLYDFT